MAQPVVADADTLFGGTTRAFLIHLDYEGLIHLHWSPMLLKEMSDALVSAGRKTAAQTFAHEALMNASLPDASVSTKDVQAAFRAVYPGVKSAKDLHVAATALAVSTLGYYATPVVALVTKNLADFNPPVLVTLNVPTGHPDKFLLGLWQQDPLRVAQAFRAMREDLAKTSNARYLLGRLAGDGQVQTAAALLLALQNGSALL